MKERKYKVIESGHILAENMDIDVALLLIKAYAEEYDRMELMISEMLDGNNDEEYEFFAGGQVVNVDNVTQCER